MGTGGHACDDAWRSHARRRGQSGPDQAGESGFGLVEVLLSLTVLLTVLVASAYLVDNIMQQAATNRAKVAATELAETWLEKMSSASLPTLQADIARDVLLTPTPVTVGGIPFSVWSHLEWADTGTSPSLCTSGNPPQVIRATMTVKWPIGQQLGETSIINPPYGAVVPGDGFLSVQIQGASAPLPPADTANLVNVAVNVTPQGGSATTYNPDQYGCVYLEEPLGTYSVSLASPAGGPTFIDWQEQLTPSQPSVSVVTAGLPAFVPAFHFDEAGTINFGPAGGTPIATGMPISISNGGNLQPSGTKVVVAAGSGTTSAQLFPYTSAYSVWYGDCTTVAGTTKEEPSSPATVTMTARGTQNVAITGLYTLSLSVSRSGGAFSAPPTATATVNDSAAPGDGCPASEPPYGLFAFAGSGSTYTDQTAVLAQNYTVKVTDPTNSSVTSVTMQVAANGVTYNGTTYPYGTPVPVTVS
ncbi:MAG TPA: hypothetical protein VKU86_04805 [Acidimicrobiales bacterium]|nr:hypothetical protein [Acidimicrobiales bacterium]